MRVLDLPLASRGRTPRELVLLVIGVGYCVFELADARTCWSNLAMYAVATAAFAWRFFPARALAVGTALGALAQRLPDLRYDTAQLETPHTWIALGTIVVLASSDLEARFERAPSRIGWLPNAWAELPARDMRRLRGCVYALGALGAGLASAWGLPFGFHGDPLLVCAVLGGLTLTVALLAAGRAPALLLVPIVCLPLALGLAFEIEMAEACIAHGCWAELDEPLRMWPQFVLPSFALALVATGLALPYCVRLARRA